MESMYGSVCYVGVDIDPELKYPKGAARITFSTTKSFVAAIAGKFVNIPHGDCSKRVGHLLFFSVISSRSFIKTETDKTNLLLTQFQVEIRPYVMDDQMCDNCIGKMCSDR